MGDKWRNLDEATKQVRNKRFYTTTTTIRDNVLFLEIQGYGFKGKGRI
jgi:hypothetical protein